MSIQIHYNGALHWVCSRMDQNQFITVYDSLFHDRTTDEFDTQLAPLYSRGEDKLNITADTIQEQRGPSDCGPFTLAVCTALAAGANPHYYDGAKIRCVRI